MSKSVEVRFHTDPNSQLYKVLVKKAKDFDMKVGQYAKILVVQQLKLEK